MRSPLVVAEPDSTQSVLASESACTVPIDSEHSPPIEGAQRFSNPVSTLCNLFRRAAASHLQLRAPGGVMHAFTRGGPPTEDS